MIDDQIQVCIYANKMFIQQESETNILFNRYYSNAGNIKLNIDEILSVRNANNKTSNYSTSNIIFLQGGFFPAISKAKILKTGTM